MKMNTESWNKSANKSEQGNIFDEKYNFKWSAEKKKLKWDHENIMVNVWLNYRIIAINDSNCMPNSTTIEPQRNWMQKREGEK